MGMYTKSIQLLLCFVFFTWSLAGPVAQSQCCSVASDTLAPPSEYDTPVTAQNREAGGKISPMQFMVFFDLVPYFMRDLHEGMSIADVRKKYAEHPLWRKNYDKMRYYGGVLLIPIGERRCLKVELGKPWEDIGPLEIARVIAEKVPPPKDVVAFPLKNVDPQTVKNILINIDAVFHKGDLIVQSILLRALLSRFSAAHVTVVTQYTDLWEGLDRVTLVKTPGEMRRDIDYFELVIDLNGFPEERFDSGKKNMVVRIDPDLNAFTFENKRSPKRYVIKTAPVDWWDLRGLHYNVYDFYVTLVKSWGLEPSGNMRPFVSIEKGRKQSLRESLESIGVACVQDLQRSNNYRTERPVILINPYSRILNKELTSESWIKIIKELRPVVPANAVFLIDRGNAERHLNNARTLQEMLRTSGLDEGSVKLLPRLRFKDLAVLISKSALVIGVDTSTAHIAGALGRNAVTVFLKKPSSSYFRPLAWTSPWPSSSYLEIECPIELKGGVLNDQDLPLFSAAVQVQDVMKSKDYAKFQSVFETSAPEQDSLNRMLFYFKKLTALLRSGNVDEGRDLWVGISHDSDFVSFVAAMKEPFRKYFLSELDSFSSYLDDDYLTEGAAGCVCASNIFKFVHAMKGAAEQKQGADINALIEKTIVCGKGALSGYITWTEALQTAEKLKDAIEHLPENSVVVVQRADDLVPVLERIRASVKPVAPRWVGVLRSVFNDSGIKNPSGSAIGTLFRNREVEFDRKIRDLSKQFTSLNDVLPREGFYDYIQMVRNPALFVEKIIDDYRGENPDVVREVALEILRKKVRMPEDVMPYYMEAFDFALRGVIWQIKPTIGFMDRLKRLPGASATSIPVERMGLYLDQAERNDIQCAATMLNDRLMSGKMITKVDIIELHKTAVQHIPNPEGLKMAGFRIFEISMAGMGPYGVMPSQIPYRVDQIVNLLNEQPSIYAIDPKTLHPVALAAKVMHGFISAHPFLNGNKRIGILLANYVLAKHGYPPFVLTPENIDEYALVFRYAMYDRELAVFIAELLEKEYRAVNVPIKNLRRTDEMISSFVVIGSSV